MYRSKSIIEVLNLASPANCIYFGLNYFCYLVYNTRLSWGYCFFIHCYLSLKKVKDKIVMIKVPRKWIPIQHIFYELIPEYFFSTSLFYLAYSFCFCAKLHFINSRNRTSPFWKLSWGSNRHFIIKHFVASRPLLFKACFVLSFSY